MKLGAILGFNGEAVRSVEMKMSRRNGEVRSLGLTAKIGRNGALTGDLRGRPGARQMVELRLVMPARFSASTTSIRA